MLVNILLLVAGFVLLLAGGESLVRGGASFARLLGVRTIVIGLTILAFGTSGPEMVVNIFSALRGAGDIAIGNILGSNMVNMLFILGLGAIVAPLAMKKATVWREIPFAFLAAIVLLIIGADRFFGGASDGLNAADGLVLLSFLIIFLVYTLGMGKEEGDVGEPVRTYPIGRTLIFIVLGLAGLVVGGKFVVDAGVDIARQFGISEYLIGMTIVAIGTSLPELAVTVIAAYRKQADLAIGNVVGSNIFNIFLILGTTSLIAPLPFQQNAFQDALLVAASALLLFVAMFIGARHKMERSWGVVFVLLYIAYVIFSVYRG